MKDHLHTSVWCLMALGLVSCMAHAPAPPPSDVPSATTLNSATDDRLYAISANAEAAEFAAGHIADLNVKSAVLGPVSVIRHLAPGPAPDKFRAEAMSLVVKALAGKLDEANQGWASARTTAEEQAKTITALQQTVAQERIAAAAELTRQLQQARDEERAKAEARERLFQQYIFSGLGTLLVLCAIATIALRAYLPLFGPQVTLWLFVAGGLLIGLGIVVRAISRLIEDHPYIFWGGIVGAMVSISIPVGLVISNHFHSKPQPA